MSGRNVLIIIAIVYLLINSLMLVTATEFTNYEIDKLSEMVHEDCKYSTFLFVCKNLDPDGVTGSRPDCIDEEVFAFWGPSRRALIQDLLKRGELLRFYKGEEIGLNETVEDWNEVHYEIRIDNISKEEVINFLELDDNKAVGNVISGERGFYCYTDKEGKQEKYFYVDRSGKKYWGDELIEDPESGSNMRFFISIGLGMVILLVLFIEWIKRN